MYFSLLAMIVPRQFWSTFDLSISTISSAERQLQKYLPVHARDVIMMTSRKSCAMHNVHILYTLVMIQRSTLGIPQCTFSPLPKTKSSKTNLDYQILLYQYIFLKFAPKLVLVRTAHSV